MRNKTILYFIVTFPLFFAVLVIRQKLKNGITCIKRRKILGKFMWQIGINVGMNLGIFPVIGLTLPLVSYGGSFIMTAMTTLGIVQSVYRATKAEAEDSPGKPEVRYIIKR